MLDPVPVFYGDVPEPLASEACAGLFPQSKKSFETPSPPSAWADLEYSDRRAYIRCSQDEAIPAFIQDKMVQHSGVKWVVENFDTSHSPFLSRPVELAGCLARLAEDFATLGQARDYFTSSLVATPTHSSATLISS